MDAIIIFHSDNTHPLAFLLNKKRRHVWCAIRDIERNSWVSYNWHQGLPILAVEAPADYDLAKHYRDAGCEVIDTKVGDVASSFPIQWNNCVGHVKTVLGIRSWSCVPNGLFKHLTRKEKKPMFKFLSFIPGFGGGSPAMPAPPAPPPAPAPVAKKTDVAVQKARADEIKRSKLKQGAGGTNKTNNLLAETEPDTAKKGLLS